MQTFEYQGRTAHGKNIHGKRQAESAFALGTQLTKEGITPTIIKPHKERVSFITKLNAKLGNKPATRDEMGMFVRQMSILVKTGVPLTAALRQLADSNRNAQFANVLQDMAVRLVSGNTLVNAMREYPEYFSPVMISMVQVGQNSGHLDEAFFQLNQYLEMESSALKRAKTALRYPALVVLSIFVATGVVAGWVIPNFAPVYTQAKIALPIPTQILIAISSFVRHHWLIVLLVLGLITGKTWHYLHTAKGKYQWGKIQLRLPVIGKILRRAVLLRFMQAFNIILNSGVPLVEGIGLAAQTLDNTYAMQEVLKLRDAVQHGISLGQAVAASPLFTALEVQMFAVSEKTGELATVLDQVATYYRRELDYDLKRLNDVMEPVMLLGLAAVIMLLALAVYLPIWNMVSLAHNMA